MPIVKFQRSAATVSWISPHTGLPEVDRDPPYLPTTKRAFLTGNSGFRFCNFAEGWAQYDTVTRKFVDYQWTTASGIYRAPSYMGIESHVFAKIATIKAGADSVTFTQTIGARTVSPEVVGKWGGRIAGAMYAIGPLGFFGNIIVGGLVGEKVAHSAASFPPIWSEISFTIFADGQFKAQLVRHSYFPSLTFYGVRLDGFGNPSNDYDRIDATPAAAYYDAVPKLDHWKQNGWGQLGKGTGGPTDGNPWNLQK